MDESLHRLTDRAFELANEGREDQAAVEELRAEAGPSGSSRLAQAAASMTEGIAPPMNEFDNHDRAYRLLRAAAANEPVEPVTAERARFFEEVRNLEEDSLSAGWDRLVRAQPALRELEADVREAAADLPDSKIERINALEGLLVGRLDRLVGPQATGAADQLLRTSTAATVADKYLGLVYGVRVEDRYSEYAKLGGGASSRGSFSFSDAAGGIAEVLEITRRKGRAREDLRRRAEGLSPEAVDGLIDDIWQSHSLEPPVEPARSMLVDAVLHPPSRVEQWRITADVLGGMVGTASKLIGMFRSVRSGGGDCEVEEDHPVRIQPGADVVEVALHPGLGAQLGHMSREAWFGSRKFTVADVQLRRGADGGVEVWEAIRDGSREPVRLGVVPPESASVYLPFITEAEGEGRLALCPAIRTENHRDRWRLWLKAPLVEHPDGERP